MPCYNTHKKYEGYAKGDSFDMNLAARKQDTLKKFSRNALICMRNSTGRAYLTCTV